jgi:signal transduction histidine kinase
VAELQQHHPSLQISFQAVGIKKRLPAETEIAIYRVCQEALNNIIKHANARTASLRLVYSHPMIILTIRDDGHGLSKQATFSYRSGSSGLGLLGMRERIASVGGTLEFSSQKGDNTTVRATIPLQEVVL